MLWNGLRRASDRGPLNIDALDAVCDRWGVSDLQLLGRSGPAEPLQLLVSFNPSGETTAFKSWRSLRDELSTVCGRPVELMA